MAPQASATAPVRFGGMSRRPAATDDPDRRAALRRGLVTLPGIVFILVVFIVPLSLVVQLAFQASGEWSLAQFHRLFETPLYQRVMFKTIWLSAIVAAIDFLLAYPLAVALSQARGMVRWIVLVCILMPFWTNLLVRAYGWIVILHPYGLINSALVWTGLITEPLPLVHTTAGVIIGMSQIMLPYMVLPISAQIQKMDPRLIHAARSLGASLRRTFFLVYFPLTLPGVFAGTLVVFVMNLGFFVIPALLGGQRDVMMAQLIDTNFTTLLNWEFAAALCVVLLIATLGFFLTAQRWFRLDDLWMQAK